MEVRSGLLDRQDPDVSREHRVQRPRERALVEGVDDGGAGHLAEGVDTRVGTSRAMDGRRSPLDRRERVLEDALDRSAVRLALPADVVSAVVLNRELERARGHTREPGLTTGTFFAQSGHTSGA